MVSAMGATPGGAAFALAVRAAPWIAALEADLAAGGLDEDEAPSP